MDPSNSRSTDELAEADARIWLEHARWVSEQERAVYDGLGRQALGFLSLDGVMIALLANAAPNLHGPARFLMAIAVWLAFISAVLALIASLPRSASATPLTGFREKRRTYRPPMQITALASEFTEMLLRVEGDAAHKEVGPLAELRGAVRSRGRLTKWSGTCATGALGLLVLSVTVRK